MAFSPQLDGKYKISLFESCSPAKTTMKKGTMYKDNLKGKVKDKICLFEQTNKIEIRTNKDHVNAENTVRVKKKVSFFYFVEDMDSRTQQKMQNEMLGARRKNVGVPVAL